MRLFLRISRTFISNYNYIKFKIKIKLVDLGLTLRMNKLIKNEKI
jgi:hypothetical protein